MFPRVVNLISSECYTTLSDVCYDQPEFCFSVLSENSDYKSAWFLSIILAHWFGAVL